jgi:hypothetical protein
VSHLLVKVDRKTAPHAEIGQEVPAGTEMIVNTTKTDGRIESAAGVAIGNTRNATAQSQMRNLKNNVIVGKETKVVILRKIRGTVAAEGEIILGSVDTVETETRNTRKVIEGK